MLSVRQDRETLEVLIDTAKGRDFEVLVKHILDNEREPAEYKGTGSFGMMAKKLLALHEEETGHIWVIDEGEEMEIISGSYNDPIVQVRRYGDEDDPWTPWMQTKYLKPIKPEETHVATMAANQAAIDQAKATGTMIPVEVKIHSLMTLRKEQLELLLSLADGEDYENLLKYLGKHAWEPTLKYEGYGPFGSAAKVLVDAQQVRMGIPSVELTIIEGSLKDRLVRVMWGYGPGVMLWIESKNLRPVTDPQSSKSRDNARKAAEQKAKTMIPGGLK